MGFSFGSLINSDVQSLANSGVINVQRDGNTSEGTISSERNYAGQKSNEGTDGINRLGVAMALASNAIIGNSPDGVQSDFERKIMADQSTLNTLSAYASVNISEVSGIAPKLLTENTPVNSSEILYQQFETSTEYKVPDAENPGNEKTINGSSRPYSVFNKYSLVNYQGSPIFSNEGNEPKHYNTISPATIKNPTASQIIEITSQKKDNVGYRYDYSDFALARYFGKIPNNMMITLRRFAFPAPDDIISPKGPDGGLIGQPDIARAVTWMGEQPGNSIAEIVKFSHGFNWKEAEAEVQEINSKKGARSGLVGGMINSNKFLRAGFNAAQGKNAVQSRMEEVNAGFDPFKETYPNHIFGPLNVIKSVLQRDKGLTFDQEFTLKFEYELRELGGANPKVLMLDQLSNILALTFNNAPFWGGAVRYIGDGSAAMPLGDLDKLRSGDYGGFITSVMDDFGGAVGDTFDSVGDFFSTLGKGAKNLLGGGLMDLFNSPQGGEYVKALLTGDPTGQWHVTVGNPLNPIMVIGNLACTGTDVAFEGSMGPEDFPERLVVTVKLKPGRPRDKAEIESMFNAGRGRFYLAPKDGSDINKSINVNAYGKASGNSEYVNTFRKITNG